MSYGTPDVYYQPEKFGLKTVAEIDYSDGCYQFDYRVVWRHEDGTLYTARDSGCSCPSPFEDFTKLEELDVLDFDALKSEVDEEQRSTYSSISATEAQDFLKKVREVDSSGQRRVTGDGQTPGGCRLAGVNPSRDELQAAVDTAHSALISSQYVGGPSEREAWQTATSALGAVATQHQGEGGTDA